MVKVYTTIKYSSSAFVYKTHNKSRKTNHFAAGNQYFCYGYLLFLSIRKDCCEVYMYNYSDVIHKYFIFQLQYIIIYQILEGGINACKGQPHCAKVKQ